MAGDWIKMRPALLTSPKVNGIARMLESSPTVSAVLSTGYAGPMSEIVSRNVMRNVTVAALLIIWSAANEHTKDGVFINADLSDIDDMVGIPGFGEAMEYVGWAIFNEQDYVVTLPNFSEYNTCGKDRSAEKNAERQAKFREKQKLSAGKSNVTNNVTNNGREEKRREEVNLVSEQSPAPEKAAPLKAQKRKHGTPEDRADAEWMFGLIRVVVPSAREPNYDTWGNDVRLMREQDKRTRQQIVDLFRWANADSFWRTNILSPEKLREKWTSLEAKRLARPSRESITADIFAGGV